MGVVVPLTAPGKQAEHEGHRNARRENIEAAAEAVSTDDTKCGGIMSAPGDVTYRSSRTEDAHGSKRGVAYDRRLSTKSGTVSAPASMPFVRYAMPETRAGASLAPDEAGCDLMPDMYDGRGRLVTPWRSGMRVWRWSRA